MLLGMICSVVVPLLLSPVEPPTVNVEFDATGPRILYAGRARSKSESSELPTSNSRAPATFAIDPRVWVKLNPASVLPTQTQGAAALYDSLRDQMVTFGGTAYQPGCGFTLPWLLSLSPVPAWSSLTPGSPCPGSVDSPSMVYDSKRDRLVVFGGTYVDYNFNQNVFNDVWVLPRSGTSVWSRLTVAGVVPRPRWWHTAIYDPIRDRMLVYGGSLGSTGILDELWSLSFSPTPTWTLLSPSGSLPGPRVGATTVYDPTRDEMILFGGGSDLTIENSVWALSLAGLSWSRLTPSGGPPTARYSHAAAFDSKRHRMLVYGGGDNSTVGFADQWELSLSDPLTWEERPSSNPNPGGRTGHVTVYDSRRDRLMLFGGFVQGGLSMNNDTWVLESSVSTATTLLRFDVNALGHGIEITWQLSSADPSVRSWVERAVTEQGPWVRPVLSSRSEGGFDRELDEGVDPGETYFYRLQVSTADAGTTTLGTKSVRAERDPNAWALSQPMPNPVSATIHVELSLPERASISLALFDLAGRRRAVLARGEYPAGSTRVDWNRFEARTTLPPGLYFLRLDGAPRLLSRRVIIAP